jgi:hypothetical protein
MDHIYHKIMLDFSNNWMNIENLNLKSNKVDLLIMNISLKNPTPASHKLIKTPQKNIIL